MNIFNYIIVLKTKYNLKNIVIFLSDPTHVTWLKYTNKY